MPKTSSLDKHSSTNNNSPETDLLVNILNLLSWWCVLFLLCLGSDGYSCNTETDGCHLCPARSQACPRWCYHDQRHIFSVVKPTLSETKQDGKKNKGEEGRLRKEGRKERRKESNKAGTVPYFSSNKKVDIFTRLPSALCLSPAGNRVLPTPASSGNHAASITIAVAFTIAAVTKHLSINGVSVVCLTV